MKNKAKKKQAHLKAKKNRALKRKRALKTRPKVKRGGLGSSFLKNLKGFEHNYAIENMADVSFSYLEKGTNYYMSKEEVSLTASDFIAERRADISFSCGVRGVLDEGNLRVSKPLTWVPEKEDPTVKDYLAELWNKEEEANGSFQILSFSFFLYDEEEDYGEDEGEDEGADDEELFLSCCVMVSGRTRDEIEGYLVMRKVTEKEGSLSLEGKNIFVDTSDVLDLIVPPMFIPSEEVEKEEGGGEGNGVEGDE